MSADKLINMLPSHEYLTLNHYPHNLEVIEWGNLVPQLGYI